MSPPCCYTYIRCFFSPPRRGTKPFRASASKHTTPAEIHQTSNPVTGIPKRCACKPTTHKRPTYPEWKSGADLAANKMTDTSDPASNPPPRSSAPARLTPTTFTPRTVPLLPTTGELDNLHHDQCYKKTYRTNRQLRQRPQSCRPPNTNLDPRVDPPRAQLGNDATRAVERFDLQAEKFPPPPRPPCPTRLLILKNGKIPLPMLPVAVVHARWLRPADVLWRRCSRQRRQHSSSKLLATGRWPLVGPAHSRNLNRLYRLHSLLPPPAAR